MFLSSAPPFFSFHPHPRYSSQMCSSSTGKLCRYHPFSPHISGRFATNLRYVECENRVFFDYATLLLFVEQTFVGAAITTKSALLYRIYIDPSFLKTTNIVLNNIFISSPMFQFVIYSLSRRTTSSKSVISLRPLTCHMPVIPGLIASLARW